MIAASPTLIQFVRQEVSLLTTGIAGRSKRVRSEVSPNIHSGVQNSYDV